MGVTAAVGLANAGVELVLRAGGSTFVDEVATRLPELPLRCPPVVVLVHVRCALQALPRIVAVYLYPERASSDHLKNGRTEVKAAIDWVRLTRSGCPGCGS